MTDEIEKMEGFGDLFVKKIRARLLNMNKNWLCVICGDTGGGKSYSALSLANYICPRGITIKRNLVFSPEEFMEKLVNSEDLKKGDILIFDEAGVGMSSREWYSIQNRLLGQVLQTFRHKNIGVIFTVPDLSFIDVQARKLFHCYMEAKHIDFKEDLAYLSVFDIQHNSRYGTTYFKHPRLNDSIGRKHNCKFIAVPKPSNELLAPYEMIKKGYTNALNKKALDEIRSSHEDKKPNRKMYDLKQIAMEVKSNPSKYLGKKGISPDKIAIEHNIGLTYARSVKNLLT